MISRPVVVSPVKAILRMRLLDGQRRAGLDAEAVDDVDARPAGSRSAISSISSMIDAGVCSAGLSTTALPAASAGASFHVAISSGKFHGMIWPTTPSGSWKW